MIVPRNPIPGTRPDLPPEPATPPLLPPAAVADSALAVAPAGSPAPLWLQRISLFILVLFCVYLGVLVAVIPWWTSVWDHNLFFIAHPALLQFLKLGVVRGVVSGLGLLDIWIGISEAIQYRETPTP